MTIAWLFPGQGAQSREMLDGLREHPDFPRRYSVVCDALGLDPLAGDDAVIHRNAVSSLLTILASSISLDLFRAERREAAGAVAGYSIGQWTALYAAGSVDFETLVGIARRRAELMDACFRERHGAMLAVIGLDEKTVASVVDELRASGAQVWISNVNCAGQYSIAGTAAAIDEAERQLAALTPKKLARVPVAGAWHCPMLADAASAFSGLLAEVTLREPAMAVIDNVSGEWLPTEAGARRERLARHVDHPVRWSAGVKTLIASGVTELVEIGFGNTLTKFGFFIDRSVKHTQFYVPAGRA